MFDRDNMRFYFITSYEYDHNMTKWISDSNELISCLNKTIQQGKSKINANWNRVYGVWMDMRKGKSIFNTKYVDFIQQHSAVEFTNKAVQFDIPVNIGFVNHFREEIDLQFFLGQTYSFYNHFRIDLEYYYFLAAFSKQTIS